MLAFTFFLAMGVFFLQGVLFSGFSLFAFAPWIALCLLRLSLVRAIWLSAGSGLFVDLFSDHPFGVHAITYAAVTFFLFRFRKHFFVDRPLHLGLYSTLVSFAGTLLLLFFLFLFDRRIPFAGIWVFGDLFGMPLFDGLYAWVLFAGPVAFCTWARRWWMLFWLKRKNLSPTSR